MAVLRLGSVAKLCWCLLAMLPTLAQAKEAFTLDQSLAAHATLRLNEADLAMACDGSTLAWIEGRSVFVAVAPEFATRALATVSDDSRPTAVHVSPDGRSVFYSAGAVTPAFAPHLEKDDRSLWRVDLHDGKPALRVATAKGVPLGDELAFSPDGDTFVTTRGAMLYEHRVVAGLLHSRPLLPNDAQHYAAVHLSNVVFSPDGKQLAFVSWRKAGQSYVAIYDFASGTARYIDPSIYQDLSPTWSPDSRRLAFVRSPGNWTREYRFSPQREGAPWSLAVVDRNDTTPRTLWRADLGSGSVFRPFGTGSWLEANIESSQLLWTASGRILFPWEKSGWVSLYSISAQGGPALAHTPGQGEIASPMLAPGGRDVIYASTIDDTARLHVWQVPVAGGTPRRLTQGNGVEHSPRALAGGHLAYIGNVEGRMPNRRMLLQADGRQRALATSVEDESQRALWSRFVDVQVLPLDADDAVRSYHLLMIPEGAPPKGGFPVIVSSKGGPAGRVSPGNGVYTALGQFAVSRGYVFVEMNYRGGTGFGLDYRLPDNRGATGGSEVRDIEALARYLASRKDVNPNRIGILGGSYGGFIVGLALTRLPQYFAAGVHMSGVADWVIELKRDQQMEGGANAPPEYLPLSERMRIEDLAFASSPTARLAAWRAPTLFTMGELDTSGHMEGIIDLGYRLMEQGTHVEFSIAPEAGHTGLRARPPERAFEFFERTLRSGSN